MDNEIFEVIDDMVEDFFDVIEEVGHSGLGVAALVKAAGIIMYEADLEKGRDINPDEAAEHIAEGIRSVYRDLMADDPSIPVIEKAKRGKK